MYGKFFIMAKSHVPDWSVFLDCLRLFKQSQCLFITRYVLLAFDNHNNMCPLKGANFVHTENNSHYCMHRAGDKRDGVN